MAFNIVRKKQALFARIINILKQDSLILRSTDVYNLLSYPEGVGRGKNEREGKRKKGHSLR